MPTLIYVINYVLRGNMNFKITLDAPRACRKSPRWDHLVQCREVNKKDVEEERYKCVIKFIYPFHLKMHDSAGTGINESNQVNENSKH